MFNVLSRVKCKTIFYFYLKGQRQFLKNDNSNLFSAIATECLCSAVKYLLCLDVKSPWIILLHFFLKCWQHYLSPDTLLCKSIKLCRPLGLAYNPLLSMFYYDCNFYSIYHYYRQIKFFFFKPGFLILSQQRYIKSVP